MSMLGNIMDVFSQGKSMFGGGSESELDSFQAGASAGQTEIADALMMQNLQDYTGGPMQGTMMGMPGTVQPGGGAVGGVALPQGTPSTPMTGGGPSPSPSFPTHKDEIAGNAIKAMEAVGGMMGGMMMSDRRLKKNIQPIGISKGRQFYQYDYLWQNDGTNEIGVMADENPDIAIDGPGGFLMVDYSRI